MKCIKHNFYKNTKSKCSLLIDDDYVLYSKRFDITNTLIPLSDINRVVYGGKTTTFIHKSYINIAREVWKNPYLFDDNIPGHEYQRNMKQLEDMIKLTIEDTIRRQLPIKEILREHLENANEPKQPQNQLDMKTLVDEIRKATSQVNNDTTDTNDTNTPPIPVNTSPTIENTFLIFIFVSPIYC